MKVSPFSLHLRVAAACVGAVAGALAASAADETPDYHLTLATSATYDDNIYLAPPIAGSAGIVDDLIWAVLPGLEVEAGDPELSHWSFSATEGFFFYADRHDENDQLAVVHAAGGVKGARSSIDLTGSFQQIRQNTRDIRNLAVLVRRDRADANLMGEYEFSPKTSIAGGVRYFSEDFQLAGFADLRRTQLPVNLYYELTPRIDVSGGYRYERSRRSGITDARYSDHFFNVGARGEFTPKISGAFKVGLARRSTRTRGTLSTLGFEGSLKWEATVKIRVEAEVSRDFNSSSLTGEPVRETDVNLRGTYEISTAWAAGAAARFEYVSYTTVRRKDDLSTAQVFLNFQPAESFGMSAAWNYEFNHSNAAYARYEHNTLSVSATFRY